MNKNKISAAKTQQNFRKTQENRQKASQNGKYHCYTHNSNPSYKKWLKENQPLQLLDSELTASPRMQQLFKYYFSNPFRIIKAENPRAFGRSGKPKYQTISGHPTRERVLEDWFWDEKVIVGCCPNKYTQFITWDIDNGSDLNPCTPEGFANIRRLLSVAEDYGIVGMFPIHSSDSGGIHLIGVFDSRQQTIALGALMERIADEAGFTLKSGQLEAFPNVKTYVPGSNRKHWTGYKGLRLPGQPGTGWQLLNDEFEPIGDSYDTLIRYLDWSAHKNDSEEVFRNSQLAYRLYKNKNKLSSPKKLRQWIKELYIELKPGFTDFGQTNALLGVIATLGRIEQGYRGQELADFIAEVAMSLPGYETYCQHQHEIYKRAQEWGRSAERFYWHVNDENKVRQGTFAKMWKRATYKPINPDKPTFTQHHADKSKDAEKRLQGALQALIDGGQQFSSETSLFAAVCQKGRELFGKALSKRTWNKLKEQFTSLIESLIHGIEKVVEKVSIEDTKPPQQHPTEEAIVEEAKTAESQADCARTQPLPENPEIAQSEIAETQADYARTQPRLYMKVFEAAAGGFLSSVDGEQPTSATDGTSSSDAEIQKNQKIKIPLEPNSTQESSFPLISSAYPQESPEIAKSTDKKKLSEGYYQQLLQRHPDWQAWEEERRSPVCQKKARDAFALIREMLAQKCSKRKRYPFPSPDDG